jgi:hypothetical protein
MTEGAALGRFELTIGAPVVIHLVEPKEQVWGVLLSLDPTGVSARGIDMRAFDEWVHQEAHPPEERMVGLSTLFYPLHRVERIERDESRGPVEGYAARLERETRSSLAEVVARDADA